MKIVVLAVIVAFCGLLAYEARPKLEAPDWVVTVHDEDRQPMGSWPITEHWKDYSCEEAGTEDHVARATSDSRGVAHFAPVRLMHNPFSCLSATLSEAGAFVHGSFGQHARIETDDVICVVDAKGFCIDWTGSPPRMRTDISVKNPLKQAH